MPFPLRRFAAAFSAILLGGCASASPNDEQPVQSEDPLIINRCILNPAACTVTIPPPPPPNVLTQHFDGARSGWNPYETTLDTTNVRALTFGRIGTWRVDGQVYAQPLYVTQSGPTRTKDLLIVATADNFVYALDAQAVPSASIEAAPVVWKTFLGGAYRAEALTTAFNMNVWPRVGAISTPVIDLANREIFLVSGHEVDPPAGLVPPSNADCAFIIEVLDLDTGHMKRSRRIDPTSAPGAPPGMAFDGRLYVQRSGLARLADGTIVVAFGSNLGDEGPAFHGWLVGIEPTLLLPNATYVPTPRTAKGGFWGSGMAPVVNGNDVVIMSGNGSDETEDGNSLIALHHTSSGFTPFYRSRMPLRGTYKDNDFGSSGPLLVGSSIVAGGKDGVLLVAQPWTYGTPSSSTPLTPAAPEAGPPIYGSAVTWTSASETRVFAWGGSDVLRSFPFHPSAPTPFPGIYAPGWLGPAIAAPAPDANRQFGGYLSISSNRAKSGSAIVWASVPPDPTGHPRLFAYDATNIAAPLYESEPLAFEVDSSYIGGRMSTPTVANGRVFVTTYQVPRFTTWPVGDTNPRQGYVNVFALHAPGAVPPPAPPPPPAACQEDPVAPSGSGTWDSVYTTLFGPTGQGKCTGCHAVGSANPAATFYDFLLTQKKVILPTSTNPTDSILGDPKRTPLAWFHADGETLPSTMPDGSTFLLMPKGAGEGCDPKAMRLVDDWLRNKAPGPM